MGNSVKEYVYKYTNFTKDIKKIISWLEPMRDGYTAFGVTPWEPDVIVSINRGGLVPGVYLSHALDIPHVPIHYQTRDADDTFAGHDKSSWSMPYKPKSLNSDMNVLLVDDINDSGKTFTDIMKHWERSNLGDVPITKRIKTCALIERYNSTFTVDFSPHPLDIDDWIVFPWEIK